MNTLIVAKHSKLEWEMKLYALNYDQVVKKYSREHANVEAIVRSHEKQLAVRELFTQVFNRGGLIMLDGLMTLNDVGKIAFNFFDLIIVLGGDNSFLATSHKVHSTPIIGVNSDPQRSAGCLTRYAIHQDQDVFDLAEKLDFQEYKVEQWARLEATLNGELIPPATSEYFLGERLRKDMSRHVLVYKGAEIEQKCSGLIVATGAGSTGWFRSSTGIQGRYWKPTDKWAEWVATEPYGNIKLTCGSMCEGEELKVYSLNDDGHISADSWDERPFNRGDEVRIFLGEPLQVLVPNE